MNQSVPAGSKTAVFRFAPDRSGGSGNARTRVGLAVDPHDRVEAAVGDPGRAVWARDDPVRCGAGTERDLTDVAGRRIEMAENAGSLPRVPDAAVGGRRDVVRVRASRNIELTSLERHRQGRYGGRSRGGAGLRCDRSRGRGRRHRRAAAARRARGIARRGTRCNEQGTQRDGVCAAKQERWPPRRLESRHRRIVARPLDDVHRGARPMRRRPSRQRPCRPRPPRRRPRRAGR